MPNDQLIQSQINAIFSEVNYLIRMLYSTQDPYMKNLLLNQLWNKTSNLQFLVGLLAQPAMTITPNYQNTTLPTQPTVPNQHPPAALPNQQSAPDQTFTRAQLAQFTGKNGKPAYVAVNGIVYDVTNNAAWSAASHFGLTAGKDLTQEFASCHAGQQWILSTMKPIGRLVD
ncbi:cytochrome b5 domain-containing protein [Pseudalkalibacillus sp. R45]|uniref:cytochrome b5 domain-containing protein n=1 Tax=Pseudalkalibacillus sp. R45 TaxID=3457433 RepID=UPI003FCE34C9